ncbi:phosphonopyruvate decarboxylase [Chloroflexota bacterium]
MSISPADFYKVLSENSIDFFTGVPDSFLKDFCAFISDNVPEDRHVVAANEGNAVAIAAGYHLGTGKLPLVYMQNSGLGNAINPLMSLCDPEIYSIPMLILVGWRGEPGINDAVQHVKDGRIQLDLLKSLEIPYEVISKADDDIKEKMHSGIEVASNKNRPFVIVVRKGTFIPSKSEDHAGDENRLLREEALELILEKLGENDVVISTTGFTSREIFEIREKKGQMHKRDFLTVGSMGHCSSIALGIAVARPERNVICIDGDSALIMHMGNLATTGMLKPKNLKHILINNKMHESVGGQRNAAGFIDIPALVKANGYKNVYSMRDRDELISIFDEFLNSEGPSFLEVHVRPGVREDLGRPVTVPGEDKRSFMDFLGSS